MSGQNIGRYQIVQELGRGGMATVFLANDPSFGRQVAVKVLPREFLHDPQFKARFEREAKAIATLEHPAIVPVYDFGEEAGQPFLVMRYMPGGSLADEMRRVEKFSPSKAAHILHQLAHALDAAHARGFIHRDIKPDNILFDQDGNAYLSDFGLVKMAETASTLTGKMLLGTPAYMSPEQARGKSKVEGKSDLYSLGVVLFEMLSGERPFEADTPMGLAMMHVNDPIPPIRDINPDLPEPLDAVISKALSKSPADRYSTAVALIDAFEAGIKTRSAGTPTAVVEPEVFERTWIEERELEPPSTREHPVVDPRVTDTLAPEVADDSATRVLAEGSAAAPELALPIDSPKVTKPRRFPVWAFGLIGVFLLAITAGGIALATGVFESTVAPAATATNPPRAEVAEEKPPEEQPTTTAAPTAEEIAVGPFSCQDTIGCVSYGPDDPIRLASALIISGPNAQLGLDSQYGIEIALDFRGEVMGHTLQLQAEDDGCSWEGGEAVGNLIVADPTILGVIGSSCSGAAVSLSPILSEAGYFMVSPSNTSPIMTDPNVSWFPGYLRTSHNDKFQGAVVADFARGELGLATASVIHDGDPYTQGLAEAFSTSFEKLGGMIVEVLAIQRGDDDLQQELRALAAAGPPDFLYYPVFMPECGLITSQAKAIDELSNSVLAAADGCISLSAAADLGPAGEGMLFSGPDLFYSGPLYEDFLAAYRAKVGSEPISVFHAHAFDATQMVLNCIDQVGVLEADGTLHIGRQDMRSCLYATSDFEGITGNLSCNPDGDCGDPRISISQLQGGEYVVIWP